MSPWGRSWWKWPCSLRKTRCGRMFFMSFLKKWSFVDFQIRNERRDATTRTSREIRFYLHKEFRAAGIQFHLHKEFRAAGIQFYLHKEIRAAEIWFYLHKEFLKKIREKSMIYSKHFRAARATLLRISSEKSWKISAIFKNFPRCAR